MSRASTLNDTNGFLGLEQNIKDVRKKKRTVNTQNVESALKEAFLVNPIARLTKKTIEGIAGLFQEDPPRKPLTGDPKEIKPDDVSGANPYQPPVNDPKPSVGTSHRGTQHQRSEVAPEPKSEAEARQIINGLMTPSQSRLMNSFLNNMDYHGMISVINQYNSGLDIISSVLVASEGQETSSGSSGPQQAHEGEAGDVSHHTPPSHDSHGHVPAREGGHPVSTPGGVPEQSDRPHTSPHDSHHPDAPPAPEPTPTPPEPHPAEPSATPTTPGAGLPSTTPEQEQVLKIVRRFVDDADYNSYLPDLAKLTPDQIRKVVSYVSAGGHISGSIGFATTSRTREENTLREQLKRRIPNISNLRGWSFLTNQQLTKLVVSKDQQKFINDLIRKVVPRGPAPSPSPAPPPSTDPRDSLSAKQQRDAILARLPKPVPKDIMDKLNDISIDGLASVKREIDIGKQNSAITGVYNSQSERDYRIDHPRPGPAPGPAPGPEPPEPPEPEPEPADDKSIEDIMEELRQLGFTDDEINDIIAGKRTTEGGPQGILGHATKRNVQSVNITIRPLLRPEFMKIRAEEFKESIQESATDEMTWRDYDNQIQRNPNRTKLNKLFDRDSQSQKIRFMEPLYRVEYDVPNIPQIDPVVFPLIQLPIKDQFRRPYFQEEIYEKASYVSNPNWSTLFPEETFDINRLMAESRLLY